MDEGWTPSIQATWGYKPNIKGGYEIFGLLRILDMVIERYTMIKIRRRYLFLRPYSNLHCNKRLIIKVIKPYSDEYRKERYV